MDDEPLKILERQVQCLNQIMGHGFNDLNHILIINIFQITVCWPSPRENRKVGMGERGIMQSFTDLNKKQFKCKTEKKIIHPYTLIMFLNLFQNYL